MLAMCVAAPLPVTGQELPGLQVIAGRRAAEVVRAVDTDSLLASYPAVARFLAGGVGEGNVAAPAETAEWGRLAGAWYVENAAYVNGQWYCCWNAVWAWKYILDGFAVQDYWYVKTEDLPPTATVERPSALTQLRVWRDDEKEWFIGYVTSGGKESPASVNGTFRAYAEGPDRMIMEPPPGAGPRTRIVFFDIGEDAFKWKRETLQEDGVTWVESLRIHAYRIPIPAGAADHGAAADVRPGPGAPGG